MTFSLYETVLYVTLGLFIGTIIGIGIGWDHSCAMASKLHRQISIGEVIVPHPIKAGSGVVYGTLFLKNQICEGR